MDAYRTHNVVLIDPFELPKSVHNGWSIGGIECRLLDLDDRGEVLACVAESSEEVERLGRRVWPEITT